ncbi:MAG: DUF3667 domain-containing protein [Cyclobacteriaceae bacterium]|nr:DUF3667 domain-containing protein [Cyclobacteriaceae bacterium]
MQQASILNMDELGKAIPISENMIDAEQGTSQNHPNEFCLNCGTKLQDVFCHHCGQKDIPQRQTLGELWTNFISSFWSYEGKFFRTTKYLITKPGFLAQEYCAGKRESYYHPARMYVFISFVFFLAFFSSPESKDEDKKKEQAELSEEDKKEISENTRKGFGQLAKVTGDSTLASLGDSIQQHVNASNDTTKSKKNTSGPTFNFDDVKDYQTVEAYDSAQLAKPASERDNWFVRLVSKRAIKVRNKYGEDSEKLGKEFVSAFKDNFSKVLFYLLPFFALLLKLLYIRRGYYYSEHLVFSIYYYNFFYLAGTLQIIVGLLPWLSWASTIIGFWIVLYLLFAMKRMYGQGWRKTILKYLVFAFLFLILVAVAFGIAAFAIFLSI